jgi:predicted dinucleotide-binding enzyme
LDERLFRQIAEKKCFCELNDDCPEERRHDGFSAMPPTLTVCNTDSLGEQVQREFADASVVKALNTVNVDVMVEPSRLPDETHLFICGNDADAKSKVAGWLCEWFGWKSSNIIDLGDILIVA